MKDAKREAAGLRRSGKMDPTQVVKPTADEQLRELKQAERSEQVFGEAQACEECARARQNDPNGLCREHLAKAMGF